MAVKIKLLTLLILINQSEEGARGRAEKEFRCFAIVSFYLSLLNITSHSDDDWTAFPDAHCGTPPHEHSERTDVVFHKYKLCKINYNIVVYLYQRNPLH